MFYHDTTPFETGLVEQTIKERFSSKRITRLVGDRAYDSDPLDKRLKKKGIELIAPHRSNRTRNKTRGWQKAQALPASMDT